MADLIATVDSTTKGFTNTDVLAWLDERIRDTIGSALVAGTNVTVTVNDGSNTITIAASGSGGFSFADPNADRIGFWDDSAGAFVALTHSAPLTISGTTLSVDSATETAAGKVELATAAETTTGTDNTRAVHPAGLKVELDKKVAASLINAKGDLFVGLSNDTVDTIAVGTNGQVLTADSTVGAGVKWATPAAGGGSATFGLSPKTSGHFLFPARSSFATSNISGATGDAWPTLIYVPNAITIDALVCTVNTLEASSSIGVYLFAPDADGHPATKVASVEGLSGASTGVKVGVLGSSVALTAGYYWAFVRTSSPGGTIRYQAHSPDLSYPQVSTSSSSPGIDTLIVPSTDIGAYGSVVSTITTWTYGSASNNKSPFIALRRA